MYTVHVHYTCQYVSICKVHVHLLYVYIYMCTIFVSMSVVLPKQGFPNYPRGGKSEIKCILVLGFRVQI